MGESSDTPKPPPPNLEACYGAETLCAGWNPMVAVTLASSKPRHEVPGLAPDCGPGEVDDFLERIRLYGSQS